MKRGRLRLLASSSTCAGSGGRINFSSRIEPDAWLRERRPSLLAPVELSPATWEGQDETGCHKPCLGSGLQPCGASCQSRAPQYGGRDSRLRLEPRPDSVAALRG